MISTHARRLPHLWVEPDAGAQGTEVCGSPSGLKLMRSRDDFYWLEAKTAHGTYVSAKRDLCLTREHFSQALSHDVAMYRRFNKGELEFVSYYRHGDDSRRLLTAGHQEAIEREVHQHFKQVAFTAWAMATSLVVILSTDLASFSPRVLLPFFGVMALAVWLRSWEAKETLQAAAKQLRAKLTQCSREPGLPTTGSAKSE